jgi:hypothetical protein
MTGSGDTDSALNRFDTIPSKPSLQACRNTVAPSIVGVLIETILLVLRLRSVARISWGP